MTAKRKMAIDHVDPSTGHLTIDGALYITCPVRGHGCAMVCIDRIGLDWAELAMQVHVDLHHTWWR